ncbi:MAG: efflux RND transporter periplasmic adaptor subunit [Stenotrophobium sp.]
MKAASRYCVVVLILGSVLTGCSAKGDDSKDKDMQAAIPVEAVKAALGPIDAAYRGTATLEAENEATVVARAGGIIEKIYVEEGQKVQAGEVLAQLDAQRLKLQVDQAQANLENLSNTYKRNAEVFQRNLVSRENYEHSKFDLQGAQAAYDQALLSLREAAIKAPISGIVTARYIKPGNMIQLNAQAFHITQMDPLQAVIYVPERDIAKLSPKQAVKMTIDAWPGQSFGGSIERINPVVDAATGTVKVTVEMAAGQPRLRPGMFGRVEIFYDRKPDALLIPREAVLTEDAQQAVFVITGGKARRRIIKTGYSDSDHYEVLAGLVAGDWVVTTGQVNLKDDDTVQVVQPAPPPTPAADPGPAG